MVTFNNPTLLILALLLVPGFFLVNKLVSRFQNSAISAFGNRQTLSRFSRFIPKTTTALVISLALAVLSIAAAEPTLQSSEDGNARTLNAIIVMDVSRSMLAEDGPGGKSRLETGITAVEKLLEAYPDGRFGLVLYTNVAVASSPTFDHEALRFILGDIRENYKVRGEGSDPITALSETGKMIEELPYTVDTVFLIGDGGKSLSAAEFQPPLDSVMKKLRDKHVHLVAAGVGGLVPAAIPVYAEDGVLVGYHHYQGIAVYTALDEIPLKRFAEETGGTYLRLTDTNALVQISRSENLDSQPVAQDSSTNLVWLPVALSILLTMFRLYPRIS